MLAAHLPSIDPPVASDVIVEQCSTHPCESERLEECAAISGKHRLQAKAFTESS
jgi:hypothetical protein